MVVQQRKAAKAKKKCRFSKNNISIADYLLINYIKFFVIIDKEASSEDEYVAEQAEEESDQYEEEEEDEDVARPNQRSSAAKRKSLAIQSKDQTESWGNYRNTIDNGPVPRMYSYIIINYFLLFNVSFI